VTHELRFLERLRQHAASLLHLPLSAIGLYAERETPRDQYALTLREPYPIVEAQLHRLGFVRNLVSSLKFRDYAMPPETSVASWVRYPDGALASDRQLHLALFVGPNSETTDVYAHWEPSWIRHPIRHYRATAVDAETGIERIRALFERDGIEYAVVPSDERVATGMEAEKN
jgi:carboxylesterase type B